MTDLAHLDVGGQRIAYRLREGSSPSIVFLPGYGSDMDGAKALAIDGFAQERGLAMLRFDYSGTGSSSGRFDEGTLAAWLAESLALVDGLTSGPLVLVASSMGAWIALHLALLRPERIRSLVGIAAAPDFTAWGFDSGDAAVAQGLTRAFWDSGQKLLLLDRSIAIDCPVRLLHGEADQEVPLDVAFRLLRSLRSSDVQLNVLKGGGHRLSEPHEIRAILHTLDALMEPSI